MATVPKFSKTAAVRRSILVRAPVETAFQALSDVEKVRQWYFDDAELDFRPGGSITFSGMEGTMRATILEIEAPVRVVMEYGPPWWGTVTWTFESVGTGASTRVHLMHTGFEGHEDWLDRFAWGWESFLKQLKACVEGRPTR